MSLIAGVDGCPVGWLCLSKDTETNVIREHLFVSTEDLLAASSAFAVMTIDIPIGLSDRGPRECDLIARKLLGPGRASSVFPAPVRAALPAATWEEACTLTNAVCGKSVSRQTFAIMDRIRDVDDRMCKDPSLQLRIREIHPELCFYFWNAKTPMPRSKKNREGVNDRLSLIRSEFGDTFTAIRSKLPKRVAADDDILDAFAGLWSAQRILLGSAVTIPEDPQRDVCGLRMEMVA